MSIGACGFQSFWPSLAQYSIMAEIGLADIGKEVRKKPEIVKVGRNKFSGSCGGGLGHAEGVIPPNYKTAYTLSNSHTY